MIKVIMFIVVLMIFFMSTAMVFLCKIIGQKRDKNLAAKKDAATKSKGIVLYWSLIDDLSEYAFRYDSIIFLTNVTASNKEFLHTGPSMRSYLKTAIKNLENNRDDELYCRVYLDILATRIMRGQGKIDRRGCDLLLKSIHEEHGRTMLYHRVHGEVYEH